MLFNNKDIERGKYLVYAETVRKLTEKTFKHNYIENKDKRKEGWHLDHKVSIKECYLNDIPPNIAADALNLQVVPPKYNLQKGSRSLMSAWELMEEVIERDSNFES
jgi:hypothetical protein